MTLNMNAFNFDDEDLEIKGPYKVLILGGGPTGLSAALYAARAELQPLILTGLQIGGQVAITHAVENYPGFPDGVGGPELVDLFQKQAERFGAVLEFDSAVEVDFSQRPFRVKGYNAIYEAETVIIATGATPRKLEVPGEVEFTGRGVSYCGTCDGWFFKGKDVIVVGGGDSALEEGDFLTRYADTVTVVHRRDELRAGVILQKRAFENPKIDFVWDTAISDIRGNGEVQTVELKNLKSGENAIKEIDGVFIFIGHTPNTEIFQGQLEMDESGYIRVNMLMETNIPGVFAAGEAADPHFRQVVTSAGMGAAAAIQANRWLQEHGR
jgi:thioredoxin reductase (NADPH)